MPKPAAQVQALTELMLIHGQKEPDAKVIESLSDGETQQLENYLLKSYLRASDNNRVKVPPRPACLDRFKDAELSIEVSRG